ncbi:hypothetical protein [Kitasatospora purpeofusca]|uniref:hypothetical protein n=1 Tax=Kitasatospora purpeofusca TaxID=67352 RepID=UPI00224CBF9A|nr:hypothetical protein [Kitasatospora purpeofusca]MCX4755672.1 hypothetical protein [Kitasatospora purpeofusca]WSR36466.1 hypothetical protein OG715_39230 [Kitasatospora purpeofusca]WSR44751.1 hypothetical protein OG196_40115 [Kitasatospora purpeofusca]
MSFRHDPNRSYDQYPALPIEHVPAPSCVLLTASETLLRPAGPSVTCTHSAAAPAFPGADPTATSVH